MSGFSSGPLSPRDLVYVLFRHQVKATVFFTGIAALATAAAILLPATYRSEAKLFLRRGRESVAIDPTAGAAGQIVNLMETRESEINSTLVVLQSRKIAEAIVDRIGPDAILAGKLPDDPTAKKQTPRWIDEATSVLKQIKAYVAGPSVTPREKAVNAIMEELDVAAPRRANVIEITYKADSPKLAQAVVKAATEEYLVQHLASFRSGGTYEFFVEQEESARDRLRAAEQAVRDAKNTLGVASIDDQRRLLSDRINTLEVDLNKTDADLAAARARVEALGQELEIAPQRVIAQATQGIPNVAADAMRDKLYELQIREREMLSKYSESHPVVVALREQVKQSLAIVESLPQERTQTTDAVHPARQQIEISLHNERPNLAAFEARRKALVTLRAQSMEELRRLNHGVVEIAELERKAAILAANQRTYAGKLEESRIGDKLESEQISNINIVQPATLQLKPAGPPRLIILVLGLAAGLSGALMLSLACEHFDDSLKTPEDIERQLELPVLLTVPRVEPQQVMLHQTL